MADLRVRAVEYSTPQSAGTPFPIEVRLNNLESTAPFWGDAYCESSGTGGHKADVTLSVLSPDGSEVFNRTRETCIPVNSFDHLGGANQIEEFSLDLPEGEYTVSAEVDAKHVSGHDQTQPQTLTVESGTSGLPDGSDPQTGGGLPWGGSDSEDNDGPLAAVDDLKLLLGGILLLLVLYILSPYAEIGSEVLAR
ncbi:hypothetical protein VB773_01430 [Haloarculaceae archaeon H-GB2-1]|nr:hypothetical protein [Haloarculaceae archaeon H-GB1-1]MEA5406375.1 hypothetical protein [Haloarculaceae archaeon H-GB2-1]